MKNKLFFSIFILFAILSSAQQICLTSQEKELIQLLNTQRVDLGYSECDVSTTLMLVANVNCKEIVDQTYISHKPSKFGDYSGSFAEIRLETTESDPSRIMKSLTYRSNYTDYSAIILSERTYTEKNWKSIGIAIRQNTIVIFFGDQSVEKMDIAVCDSERFFGAEEIKDFPTLSMVVPESSIMEIYAYTYSGEKLLYDINTQSNFLNKGEILEIPLDEASVATFEFIFRPRLELIVPAKPTSFTIGSNERGTIKKTIEFSGNSVSDVESYLKTGVNIDITDPLDNNKYTMLHRAVRLDNIEVVEYLLEKGAKINKQSADSETPIQFCKSIEMFELLMNNNASLNTYSVDKTCVLHAYAIDGLLEPIKRIVYDGLVDINSKDRSGGTPLLYAVQFNQYETVKLLLKNGAKQLFGWQVYPIHYACENGNLEIVRLLVEYGADVNAKTGSGSTPLYYAKLDSKSNTELIAFLIENGAK